MIFVLLFSFALAASCFYVAWAGDRDEKIALFAYGLASIVSAYVVSPLSVRFRGLEWSVMAVDAMLLMPFLWIVLRSTRNWPLWMTAIQVVSIVTNSVVMSAASRHAYAANLYLLSYGVLGSIVVGSYRSRKQRLAGQFTFEHVSLDDD
jgi:hypothetical protein